MLEAMYEERGARLPGATLWTSTPDGPGATGRVLPDGCMDLLVWQGTLTVAGPDSRAYLTTDAGGAPVTGLRLPPGTGPRVFGVPARELRDRRVPLDALWPAAEVRRLHGRLAAGADPGRLLEAVAAGRLAAGRGPDAEPRRRALVDAVVAAARRGESVGRTAWQAGLSERQLHRRCLDAFGYGAKTLARILRMHRALDLARAGLPLAGTALRAGYADQAHLSREIRALAGVPVTALLRPASPTAAAPGPGGGRSRERPGPGGG